MGGFWCDRRQEMDSFTGGSIIMDYGLLWSNSLRLKTFWWICFLQTCSFCLLQMINDGLWIIVMFLSDSHSDGTHSLQSIHYWDSVTTLLLTWWGNTLIYILDCLRVSTFSAYFYFWVNYSVKMFVWLRSNLCLTPLQTS